jgi:hypothetical protein
MRAMIVALAVLAAGCTTFDLDTGFTKPEASILERTWDELECHRRVVDEPETFDPWVGGVSDAARVFAEAVQRERLMAHCMRARGYEPTRPPGWLKSVNLRSLGFD